MPELKLSNNASSLLAADVGPSATSIAISSGDEGNFPSLGAGEWHPLTVVDGSGNREHMRCTGRSGVTLTVVRAQEGTTALSWTAGARVELRLTAGAFHEHTRDASRLDTGTVPNAVLPGRLKETALPATDIDTVDASGWYTVDGSVSGLPISTDGYLWHVQIDADTAAQEYQPVDAMDRYGRRKEAGTWGSWYLAVLPGSKLDRLVPAGLMAPFGGATAPTGWLLCYGQAVSRTTYADLFDAIGTLHGSGDGSTTFNLPDLRGRTVAGKDNMGGSAANRLSTAAGGVDGATLGAAGGAATHTLTTDQIAAHTHPFTTGASGTHAHSLPGNMQFITLPFEFVGMADDNGSQRGHTPGSSITTSQGGDHTHSGTTNPSGGGNAHPIVQPTIVENYIIKF